jgi:putative transposase
MKRSRFSEEQIIGILCEREAGTPTADLCRKHGISSRTFYKWKAKYGGLDVSDAKRLKALEDENAKLKTLLAETMLDNAIMKDIRLAGRLQRHTSAFRARQQDTTGVPKPAHRACRQPRQRSEFQPRTLLMIGGKTGLTSRTSRRRFGAHWCAPTTPLERILREIRRRTRVVGAFPDGQSALNLAVARLRHIAGNEWSTNRYLMMDLLKNHQTHSATA